jgi:hypothetical protein
MGSWCKILSAGRAKNVTQNVRKMFALLPRRAAGAVIEQAAHGQLLRAQHPGDCNEKELVHGSEHVQSCCIAATAFDMQGSGLFCAILRQESATPKKHRQPPLLQPYLFSRAPKAVALNAAVVGGRAVEEIAPR